MRSLVFFYIGKSEVSAQADVRLRGHGRSERGGIKIQRDSDTKMMHAIKSFGYFASDCENSQQLLLQSTLGETQIKQTKLKRRRRRRENHL